ncbi:hypothetical protein EI94DRAFT_1735291 [Lactarius quietus]|nr:hypothetical protein EI94DRAFT_1735291 [Lactarius quietus]
MTSSYNWFLPKPDLPPQDHILAMCKEAQKNAEFPCPLSPFGANVTIHEATTQDWVAKELDAMPDTPVRVPRVYAFFTSTTPAWDIGYIIMEYIDAPDSTLQDVRLVVKAVQKLTSIRGPVMHNFFVDDISPFLYKDVNELQSHVNGILRHMPDKRRVDLVADASNGLFLCPCDIHPGNFKKLPDNTIVAIDFRYTCFLPPSFFGIAMRKQHDVFGQVLSQLVGYTESDDVEAMVSASYYLVPFQKNDVGAPKRLRRHQVF